MIKIYTVWHNGDFESEFKKQKQFKYINLSTTPIPAPYNTNKLAENQLWFYDCKKYLEPTEYVGFVSGRFNHKYPIVMKESKLNAITMLDHINPRENVVIAPYLSDKVLFQMTESSLAFPGMDVLIADVITHFNIKIDYSKKAVMHNNFICHIKVYHEFINTWRIWMTYLIDKHGMDLPFINNFFNFKTRETGLMGEVLTYLYFASRFDLTIEQLEPQAHIDWLPSYKWKKSQILHSTSNNYEYLFNKYIKNESDTEFYLITPNVEKFGTYTLDNNTVVFHKYSDDYLLSIRNILGYIRSDIALINNEITRFSIDVIKAQKLLSLNTPIEEILQSCRISD